jgi:hypothetical protein
MKIHQQSHICQHRLQLHQIQPSYFQQATPLLLYNPIQIMNQNHQLSALMIALFSFNIQSSFSLLS